jgi:hypothetical protein
MKIYSGCPKKLKARQETIIKMYRKYFSDSLPEEKQYWTMCATHTDGDGQLLMGSELDQMLRDGLITINQFHGVDIDLSIIDNNSKFLPQAHWYLGDFYNTMVKNINDFNPGIVNCDHLKMPQSGGAAYVSKCLAWLSGQNGLMFISNLILTPPRHNASCSPDEYIAELYKYPQFKYAMNHGWEYENNLYVYDGTGLESRTVLGTMVFYKL